VRISTQGPDRLDAREQQTYPRVAELVLANAGTPLRAREIIERGIERRLFGDHSPSQTPEKSMQARLSMDIVNRKEVQILFGSRQVGSPLDLRLEKQENRKFRSRFTRPDSAPSELVEYIAKPRVLRTRTTLRNRLARQSVDSMSYR